MMKCTSPCLPHAILNDQLSGVQLAMSGSQTVRRGRHDTPVSSVRVGHRRELEEEVHGRLDLHLHRPCSRLGQPVQADEVLHPERDGHVPRSREYSNPNPRLVCQPLITYVL